VYSVLSDQSVDCGHTDVRRSVQCRTVLHHDMHRQRRQAVIRPVQCHQRRPLTQPHSLPGCFHRESFTLLMFFPQSGTERFQTETENPSFLYNAEHHNYLCQAGYVIVVVCLSVR